ncbi:hypothetical protein D3C86_1533830 [compost metagenome]
MITVVTGNDLITSGIPFGQLHSALYRFGTGIGEIYAVQAGRQMLRQQVRILYLWRLNHLAVHHDM